jgi:hypothetical protein
MGQGAVVLFESSRGGIMKTDQKSKSQKALCLPFELLLMETRYGCVSFCISPVLAQLDARYMH